jgi:chemosensory pili system protein ChpA (sensor histidine kinase/response regulator)
MSSCVESPYFNALSLAQGQVPLHYSRLFEDIAMQSEQQQRIMGYFIEEAKDHLNIIEQGLLSLQSTMENPEMLDEVYRSAHSIKGGAAMLGIISIQKTAHRLEDCFNDLKKSPVKVDRQLESLFLQYLILFRHS